jgi:hypothetical protein
LWPAIGLYHERRGFSAQVTLAGKVRSLGGFAAAEAAVRAYDQAAALAFGEFARLNLPKGSAE